MPRCTALNRRFRTKERKSESTRSEAGIANPVVWKCAIQRAGSLKHAVDLGISYYQCAFGASPVFVCAAIVQLTLQPTRFRERKQENCDDAHQTRTKAAEII